MIQTQSAWNEVLKREDLIGGDIESQEDGVTYRGPLAEIKEDGNVVRFSSPWCARLNPETGEWENWHITSSFASKDMVTPQDIGNGRVFFQMPFLGVCTIFPKNGNKLDTKKIKGLPKDSERLLALYPDLPFDRTIAEKLCREKTFPAPLETLPTLPPEATLRDLLAKFRHDSSAEEFLWHYIEAVTDEKDVHHKVY